MDLIIKAARLYDGSKPAPVKDAAVLVSDGIIKSVLPAGSELPKNAEIIDLGERTILPGLIDAHMHLLGVDSTKLHLVPSEREPFRALVAAGQVKKMLESGITAARCLGSSIGPDVRRAIDDGHIVGPRLKAAGEFICSTSGTWDVLPLPYPWMKLTDLLADGVEGVRLAVRKRVRGGSDFIKIGLSKGPVGDIYHPWGDDPLRQSVSYSLEETVAVVDESHRNGLKVSAHCIGEGAVAMALDAGIDVIEHGYAITEETRKRLADSGVPVVTTITQLRHHELAYDGFHYSQRERELYSRHSRQMRSDFEKGLRAGVRYCLGSDLIGPPTHPQWRAATEFTLAVEWGMSPGQALNAGTALGAEVLGMQDQIGTLSKGKLADIIAVKQDPMESIETLENPDFVMLGGSVIVPHKR